RPRRADQQRISRRDVQVFGRRSDRAVHCEGWEVCAVRLGRSAPWLNGPLTSRALVDNSLANELNESDMTENNDDQKSSISNARSPEEIGEYWDSHSLGDHWDRTYEVEFKIRAPHRITLEPEVYERLQKQAESTGVSLANLANSWLKDRLTDDKAA